MSARVPEARAPEARAKAARTPAWARQRERGSSALLRVMLWITLRLGWHAGAGLLYPIALWYHLASPGARAASRDFLGRARGRPARAWEVYRHLLTFARVTLDRVFLLTDRVERFRVEVEGLEHLDALVRRGQGCVLLGGHLGSFEVLRSVAKRAPVPVRPLMFRRNAGALTRLLEGMAPEVQRRVIDIGTPSAMLSAHEAVSRGEIVGILADRAPCGQRSAAVDFMGGRAEFPTGPIALAATLGAPVVLFFGVRTGRRRYAVRFEPFAERVVLRRESRHADLAEWVGRFAARLEVRAREHPENWFNFFPFWKEPADATPVVRPRAARGWPVRRVRLRPAGAASPGGAAPGADGAAGAGA